MRPGKALFAIGVKMPPFTWLFCWTCFAMVGRSASKGEIKAAYRFLALKYHPDMRKHSNDYDGGQMFSKLTEAYQVLADDHKRKSYDVTLGVRRVRQHKAGSSYHERYHARTKKKPGPISREKHQFDYEAWKAWHYGDNAYVQSNIKQKYVVIGSKVWNVCDGVTMSDDVLVPVCVLCRR